MRNPSFSRFGFDETLYNEAPITVLGLRGYAHLPMQGGAYFVYVHRGICQARGDVVLTAGMYAVVNWVNPDMTIVDGFHRWTVSGQLDVYKLTGGMVPVVVIQPLDMSSQMMATVRHNRARGIHGVLKMADIVERMLNAGVQVSEICRRLQMETEEVYRLANRKGIPKTALIRDAQWSESWVPK